MGTGLAGPVASAQELALGLLVDPRATRAPTYLRATDLGRRVVQCRCGRASRWTGERDVVSQGWHRERSASGEVVLGRWTCAECAPKPAHARAVALGMPVYLRHLIDAGKIDVAIGQLELLRSGDEQRFAAMLNEVRVEVRALGRKRSPWRRIAQHLGRVRVSPSARPGLKKMFPPEPGQAPSRRAG